MDAVERLTLEAADAHSLLAVEHVHRYELAAELCEGLSVVDLCCGSGYGSRILRERCPRVKGVDVDVGTIDLAMATVGKDADVEFEVADAVEFLQRDLGDGVEAIVMFEGLEHVADPTAALAGLRRQGERGMRIVVSVPNGKAIVDDNPFHVTDFGLEDVNAIAEGFDDSVVLFQFLAEGSLIRGAEGGDEPGSVVALERGELDYANHFLVCANLGKRAGRPPEARMHVEVAPLHNRYLINLERANVELRRTNARLARGKLGKSDSAAASLIGKLEAERAQLESLRKELEVEVVDPAEAARAERQHLIQRIEELHDQVLAQDRQVREMVNTRVWRLGSRFWAMRDRLRGLKRR